VGYNPKYPVANPACPHQKEGYEEFLVCPVRIRMTGD